MQEKKFKNFHVQNKLRILNSTPISRNNFKKAFIVSKNYKKLVKNIVSKGNRRKNRLMNWKNKYSRNKRK